MDEVLELRRENHIHENHGEPKGDEKILAGFLKRLGASRETRAVARWQIQCPHGTQRIIHRIAECLVCGEIGDNGYLTLTLEPVDLIGPARLAEIDEVC